MVVTSPSHASGTKPHLSTKHLVSSLLAYSKDNQQFSLVLLSRFLGISYTPTRWQNFKSPCHKHTSVSVQVLRGALHTRSLSFTVKPHVSGLTVKLRVKGEAAITSGAAAASCASALLSPSELTEVRVQKLEEVIVLAKEPCRWCALPPAPLPICVGSQKVKGEAVWPTAHHCTVPNAASGSTSGQKSHTCPGGASVSPRTQGESGEKLRSAGVPA